MLEVLLVEDSVDILELLRAMLGEIGDVDVVASAATEADALDALARHNTDLVIIDLELESGSGLGLLKLLTEGLVAGKKIKVVVFSNYSNLVIRHRCLSLGAAAFFDKSFQIEELFDYVQAQALEKIQGLGSDHVA